MSAYTDALADPNVREAQPGIIMRPFHVPIPGNEQEWHVYCREHSDFGFCGIERHALSVALGHAEVEHARLKGDT